MVLVRKEFRFKTSCFSILKKIMKTSSKVLSELSPEGVLRAGINLSNFLLVSGRDKDSEPIGIAPDLARALAEQLGVPVRYISYASPGKLTDDAGLGVWDVGLIGAEPQRAEKMAFSPAYVEIAATFMVGPKSNLQSISDVDRPAVRIASTARAAYDLWLENNIKHAQVIRADTVDGAFDKFVSLELDALAGLRPRLIADVQKVDGARILEGQFASVQQSIGTARPNKAGATFIYEFVENAKKSGLIASLIEKHGVQGLSVAPTVK
jgi:polar amino acid transport system substrate-binding protein